MIHLINSIACPKIGIILDAGLGNQLFMLFTLISYCIDHKTGYIIYSKKEKRSYWDTFLESFRPYITTEDPENQVAIYNEPQFHYKEIPTFDYDVNLKGYFQSYKYFNHNIRHILKFMNLKKKLDHIVREFPVLMNKKSIALHFRIGDYMGLQPFHPIQKPLYYVRAFKHLIEELRKNNDDISNYNILYFCQASDNHIVDQYLSILKNTFKEYVVLNFVKVPDNIDDWKQMLIMTHCDHFIIANSTFSWFPAYISGVLKNDLSGTNPVVCYPSHWFGPLYASHNTSDLFLESWNGFNDENH
jgi:hypothetical protein